MNNSQSIPTRTMKAVNANSVISYCCESDCKVPITLDKKDVNSFNRCVACSMRLKLQKK
jgi:hypothetical protein